MNNRGNDSALQMNGGAGSVAGARGLPAPGASPSTPASSAEPKLRDYLRILGYHWKLLLLVAIAPIAGSVAYTFTKSKRYRARTVLVRSGGTGSRRGDPDTALRIALDLVNHVGRGERNYRRLRDSAHRHIVKEVEGKLRFLPPKPEALPSMVSAAIENRGTDLVITAVVSQGKGDQGMEPADYGKLAAIISDAFADSLRELAVAERQELLNRKRTALQKQLAAKSEALGRKRDDIFERRAKISGATGASALTSDEVKKGLTRLEELEILKQKARFRKQELSERLLQLKESFKKAGEKVVKVEVPNPDLRDLKAALVKAEMALAQAEIRYRETHPKYKKLVKERDFLLQKVREVGSPTVSREEPAANVGRLRVQLDVAGAELAGIRARLKTIDDTISEQRKQISTAIGDREHEKRDKPLSDMLREEALLVSAIGALQKRLEELDESDVVTTLPRLEVLSKATAPSAPYSPRWSVNLPVGVGLAMVLILAAAFIAENLEDRIRDQRDLMQHFHLPFLGPVPLWREGEPKLINLERPRSIIADVYGVLRNSISYALPPGAPKVLLVASSVVGEGKSTIAANLAISYCLDGNNVLLIDADLRRPRAHRLFESLCPQAANSPGLTGYLSGRVQVEEVLYQASVPGLSIISAGRGAVNPSKLLGSEEMRRLLVDVTAVFDAVILDGPAVLPVVDSTVVSGLASGVLLVVSSRRAAVEQVGTAIGRLEHVKAPLVGMVLNRQPGGSRGYYHYYGSRYGYGYGQSYGYTSDEEG